MTVRGYVLVTTDLEQTREVAEALKKLPGVTTVDIVAGAYDIVAVIDRPEPRDIGDILLNHIRGLRGITGTLTLISVS